MVVSAGSMTKVLALGSYYKKRQKTVGSNAHVHPKTHILIYCNAAYAYATVYVCLGESVMGILSIRIVRSNYENENTRVRIGMPNVDP